MSEQEQRRKRPSYYEVAAESLLASLLSYKTTLLRWLKPLQSQRHPSKSRL